MAKKIIDKSTRRAGFDEAGRLCDFPNCGADGDYRAPKSPRLLEEFHWFCLEHVRNYNKAWNYCAGMSEDEIERQIRRATIWDRDTWPSFGGKHAEQRLREAIMNGASFYGFEGETRTRMEPPKVETPESNALAVFGLTPPTDIATIKVRYRLLVKQHHPDANQENPDAEEHIKRINQAFQTLKKAYEFDKTH